MRQYLDQLRAVRDYGEYSADRTGTGTYRLFGLTTKYRIDEYVDESSMLPVYSPILLTSKFVNYSAVIKELLWMLSGSTNIKDLGCKIWDEWADENGDLGKIYGHQWRHQSIDQIKELERLIKEEPFSRRLIVESWNVNDLAEMALPPCHKMFQVSISQERQELDLLFYQRSADMFLGVPFNLAFYSILQCMLCMVHGYKAGTLTHMIGDAHIYSNHMNQVNEQLSRKPIEHKPKLWLPMEDSILDYNYDSVVIADYKFHPAIKAPISV